MSLIISRHSKIRISLYKVSVDVPKVLHYVYNGVLTLETPDPIDIFNTEQFKDFIQFLSEYPDKQDFHILEVHHHIC